MIKYHKNILTLKMIQIVLYFRYRFAYIYFIFNNIAIPNDIIFCQPEIDYNIVMKY